MPRNRRCHPVVTSLSTVVPVVQGGSSGESPLPHTSTHLPPDRSDNVDIAGQRVDNAAQVDDGPTR